MIATNTASISESEYAYLLDVLVEQITHGAVPMSVDHRQLLAKLRLSAGSLRPRNHRCREYGRVEVVCESCGRVFTRPLAWVQRYRHHFCGFECRYGKAPSRG